MHDNCNGENHSHGHGHGQKDIEKNTNKSVKSEEEGPNQVRRNLFRALILSVYWIAIIIMIFVNYIHNNYSYLGFQQCI
jgi:hypothetical protein